MNHIGQVGVLSLWGVCPFELEKHVKKCYDEGLGPQMRKKKSCSGILFFLSLQRNCPHNFRYFSISAKTRNLFLKDRNVSCNGRNPACRIWISAMARSFLASPSCRSPSIIVGMLWGDSAKGGNHQNLSLFCSNEISFHTYNCVWGFHPTCHDQWLDCHD